MFVSYRMTSSPVTVKPETSVLEAQATMRKNKVHRLPVLDKQHRLVGIVTEKDLLSATPSPATTLNVYEISELLTRLPVSQVMSSPVISVESDTPIEEAARLMADNDIGGLPVTKEGELAGIITESDLFRVFLEMMGSRESGLRVTLNVPEERGELAKLSSAIAQSGGNIVALGTFLGGTANQGLMTVKVQDIDEETLRKAVGPLVHSIVDLRTTP